MTVSPNGATVALPSVIETYAEAKAAFTRRYLERVLVEADGKIYLAALIADVHRSQFYRMLAQSGVPLPSKEKRAEWRAQRGDLSQWLCS